MKKFMYITIVIAISLVFLLVNLDESDVGQKGNLNNIYLFYGEGCSYCASLESYLNSLPKEVKDTYNLVEYEVWNNNQNGILMGEFAEYFEEEADGVPYLIIGDKTFIGYSDKYNEEILNAIILLNENNIDVYDFIS